MPSAILVALLLLAGCFQPDSSRIVYRCDSANPCPDGLACSNGTCGSAMQTGSDLGGDMAETKNTGCADGMGFPVGMAWACPGTFGSGQAAGRCAATWSICTDASKVDLTKCNLLDGFFVADVRGKWTPAWGTSVTCVAGGMFDNKVFFGCGILADSEYKPDTTFKCSGFGRAVSCPTLTTSWDCPGSHDLSLAINKVLKDGVLCCK